MRKQAIEKCEQNKWGEVSGSRTRRNGAQIIENDGPCLGLGEGAPLGFNFGEVGRGWDLRRRGKGRGGGNEVPLPGNERASKGHRETGRDGVFAHRTVEVPFLIQSRGASSNPLSWPRRRGQPRQRIYPNGIFPTDILPRRPRRPHRCRPCRSR